MNDTTESTIVLTDPKPLPRGRVDGRCPQCRAEKTRRVKSAGFGQPHDVCGQCGHDFPFEESDRG